VVGLWFSLGTPDSFNNKTDRHDITEILLKVALSTITLAFTTVLFIKRDNAIDKPNFWKDFSIMKQIFDLFILTWLY
jgi:uncharacterized membrane protein